MSVPTLQAQDQARGAAETHIQICKKYQAPDHPIHMGNVFDLRTVTYTDVSRGLLGILPVWTAICKTVQFSSEETNVLIFKVGPTANLIGARLDVSSPSWLSNIRFIIYLPSDTNLQRGY